MYAHKLESSHLCLEFDVDSLMPILAPEMTGYTATLTVRVSVDGDLLLFEETVEIGAGDKYVPVCRHHWLSE